MLLSAWQSSRYYRGLLSDWVDVNPVTLLPPFTSDSAVSFVPMEAVGEKDGSVEAQTTLYSDVATGYTRFAEGDVIWAKITPCMQNGKSAVPHNLIEKVGFGSTEFHVLRPKTEQVLSEFLLSALQSDQFLTYVQATYSGSAGQQRIPDTVLKNLPLPLPPLSIQRELVDAMQSARARRAAQLQAADAELAGIDAFLLKELGLIAPPADDRPTFALRFSQMTGNSAKRCDYDFHSPHFQVLLDGIAHSTYGAAELQRVCHSFTTGFAAGRDDQADGIEEAVPHVRPFNISPQGEFTLETIKYVPRSSVQPSDFLAQGEVLFNNTNSSQWVGKTTVFDSKTPCVCSNHITRLKINEEVAEPNFVAEVLNALRGYGVFSILATNFNNQAGINTQTLSEFKIPLPPVKQQQSIASDIMARREGAQARREQAAREWEQAKAEFERRLLGAEATE